MPVIPANTLTAQSIEAKFASKQRRYTSQYSYSYDYNPPKLPPVPEPLPALEPPLAASEPLQVPAHSEGSTATPLLAVPEPPPAVPEPLQMPAHSEGSTGTFAAWRAAKADLNLGDEAHELDEPAAVIETPARAKRPSRRALLGTSATALMCMIAAGAYYTRTDWMPLAATTVATGMDQSNPVAPAHDVAALPAPDATTEIPPAQQADQQPPAAPRSALTAANAAAQATPGLRWAATPPALASKSAAAATSFPAPASQASTLEPKPVVFYGPNLAVPSSQPPQLPAAPVITVKPLAPPEQTGTTTALASTPAIPNPALPVTQSPALAAETPSAPERPTAPEMAESGAVATQPNVTDQQLTNTLTVVMQIADLLHTMQADNGRYRARTDTLQTKIEALQIKSDNLGRRLDVMQGENARLRVYVRNLAVRIQGRPVTYEPHLGSEARP